jgi:hypothetical protein
MPKGALHSSQRPFFVTLRTVTRDDVREIAQGAKAALNEDETVNNAHFLNTSADFSAIYRNFNHETFEISHTPLYRLWNCFILLIRQNQNIGRQASADRARMHSRACRPMFWVYLDNKQGEKLGVAGGFAESTRGCAQDSALEQSRSGPVYPFRECDQEVRRLLCRR